MLHHNNCYWLSLVVVATCFTGCSETATEDVAEAPPVMRATPSDKPVVLLPRELRRKLKANEKAQFERSGNDIVEARLAESGIKSIEALKGLPLRFLDLYRTEVTDLTPLAGMPLQTLILEETDVADISPIKGMELKVLHMQDTKVTDLSPLNGMPIEELNLKGVPVDDLTSIAELPLQTLWVPGSKIKDITPLQGKAMVSLDIEGTDVNSINPLQGMSTLKRLNIARTPVTDVSPLAGLRLDRITLTPETVTTGMEVLRAMSSLAQIRTTMEGPGQSAAEFWAKYDRGVWNAKPDEKPETPEKKKDKSPQEASPTADATPEEKE